MPRSFTIQYTFAARDKFSTISRKIREQNKLLATSFRNLNTQIKNTGRSLDKIQALTGFISFASRVRRSNNSMAASFRRVTTSAREANSSMRGMRYGGGGMPPIPVGVPGEKKPPKTPRGGPRERAAAKTGLSRSYFLSPYFRQYVAAYGGYRALSGFLGAGGGFEQSLAALSAITGATGHDLDYLRDKMLALSKTAIVSQSDVANAVTIVASAKPELLHNLPSLMNLTKQTMLLANAAGMDAAPAAEALSGALNAYGKSAKDAHRYVEIMAAGQKYGSSMINQTSQALTMAAPAAYHSGVSFLQLNAAIQALAKGNIKASMAGTGLNAILLRMPKYIQNLDFKKMNIATVFEKLDEKFNSITSATQRAALATKLFGLHQTKVGYTLMTNAKFMEQIQKKLKEQGIAEKQASVNLHTFDKRWQHLVIVLRDSAIRTFLRLSPYLSQQVDALAKYFDNVSPDQIKGFVASLKSLVAVLVTVGRGLGYMWDVLKGIGTAIGTIAGEVATLNMLVGKGSVNSILQHYEAMNKLQTPTTTGPKIGATHLSSNTRIDVNMNAPKGLVGAVITQSTGAPVNVGLNMVNP